MNAVQTKGLLEFLKSKGYNVWNDTYQLEYVEAIAKSCPSPDEPEREGSSIAVFVNAEAGTGKTTLATLVGAYCVGRLNLLDGIIYIRTEVDVDSGNSKDRGALPGDDNEKTAPYQTAFIEALDEYAPRTYEDWSRPVLGDRDPRAIATHPGHYRGITKSRKFVIIDEAQNWTTAQLQAVFTRFKQNCVIVVIGHSGQCDLPKKKQDRVMGLLPFEVYAIHHKKKGAWVGTLKTNYRGPFAKWSDQIKITIEELLKEGVKEDGTTNS